MPLAAPPAPHLHPTFPYTLHYRHPKPPYPITSTLKTMLLTAAPAARAARRQAGLLWAHWEGVLRPGRVPAVRAR